jgi:hypothetical protein
MGHRARARDRTTPLSASSEIAPQRTSTTTATRSETHPATSHPAAGTTASDAWEDVNKDAAKALEMHPERPLLERPPPEHQRDIGLGIDL